MELVNHLGLDLGEDAETMLGAVAKGRFGAAVVPGAASTPDYAKRVRAVDAPSPSRFNADATRLFEASGCAGKLMVLAVQLDTFPKDRRTATFYIGTNDPGELDALRRRALGVGRIAAFAGVGRIYPPRGIRCCGALWQGCVRRHRTVRHRPSAAVLCVEKPAGPAGGCAALAAGPFF
ncbi:FAD/FMN-containing dehydrogenase [Novosphingobium sp. SG916]|nr:FAD/FMN-containing dehydrogenase [Novosphingobium sp. SG916]